MISLSRVELVSSIHIPGTNNKEALFKVGFNMVGATRDESWVYLQLNATTAVDVPLSNVACVHKVAPAVEAPVVPVVETSKSTRNKKKQ